LRSPEKFSLPIPLGIPTPDAQINFILEKKPKKRQRKQKIAKVTNDEHWKGEHFMDSLIEYDSSINESSLNQVIEPKKLKIEPRKVDKADNSQMDRKKPKDQNDLLEIQVPFISENKPKKRQRKQQISERKIFEGGDYVNIHAQDQSWIGPIQKEPHQRPSVDLF
jgi:hypothetical protein